MSVTRIYRCTDGHLYTAGYSRALFKSIHLGLGTHFQKCPVDGRWRKATLVEPNELSEAELASAKQHTFN